MTWVRNLIDLLRRELVPLRLKTVHIVIVALPFLMEVLLASLLQGLELRRKLPVFAAVDSDDFVENFLLFLSFFHS